MAKKREQLSKKKPKKVNKTPKKINKKKRVKTQSKKKANTIKTVKQVEVTEKKSKKRKKALVLLIVIALLSAISPLVVKAVKSHMLDEQEKLLGIKLNGDESITVEYGKEYKDEGATASYDNLDITSQITVDTYFDLKKVGTYSYKYTINYKESTKTVERKVTVKDTTKPSIKLNGKGTITIYKGSKYSDKGAKATDNYDGDITKNIVKSGDVNTKKNGTYTITYKVSDSSKNEASVSRKVKVIDKPVAKKTTKVTKTTSKKISTSKTSVSKYSGKSSKGYTIEKKNGIYYVGGILIANKTYSLPTSYNPGGLLKVFTSNFNKMKEAAKKDGVTLKIISGFRSYSTQKTLYNNYVKSDGRANADRYSARPGHSEHQTGLAADINKISYTWHTTKDGKWLYNNCYKYGFIIRYTKNGESKTGYKFEPWHIRYVGVDIATKLYNKGNWISLEEYLGITSKYQ